MPSRSHQGDSDEKKSFSICRACSQVMFALRSFEDGCFTQNQLLSRGFLSFRMKGIQLDSSPVGMRSGFVRTPSMKSLEWEVDLDHEKTKSVPIVLLPSGSCSFASRCAPWFSKSAILKKVSRESGIPLITHSRRQQSTGWYNLASEYTQKLNFVQGQCHFYLHDCCFDSRWVLNVKCSSLTQHLYQCL